MHRRPSKQRGFSLVELMVTLTIISVIALVAVPRLGKGRGANEAARYARSIALELKLARVRAISTRNSYLVQIRPMDGVVPAGVTTRYIDDSGTPQQERDLVPPNEAQVWAVHPIGGTPPPPPTVQDNAVQVIHFNPDSTVLVTPMGSTEANIYVTARQGPTPGRVYKITVNTAGRVSMVDVW